MASKKEGARKTDEAKVVSILPDVCLTPMGPMMVPVGYNITAKLGMSERTVRTVRLKGLQAFTMTSRVPKVEGDEPGIGGGIHSSVNLGYCRPATHCKTVVVGGAYIIHHTSLFYMNCNGPEGIANTVGKLVYIKAGEAMNANITEDDVRQAVKTLARGLRPGWWSQMSEDFENKVRAMAAALKTDPNYLMACFRQEAGPDFAANATNASSGAVGMIQFTEVGVPDVGTATGAQAIALIKKMTPEQQLPYVQTYLQGKGDLSNLSDLYMAVFLPAYVGKPDSTVVLKKGWQGWEGNKKLDTNHDDKITKSEATAPVRKFLKRQIELEKAAKDGVKVAGPKPGGGKKASSSGGGRLT